MELVITPIFLGLVPFVMATAELSKIYIQAKWIPIIVLVLSLGLAFLVGGDADISVKIMQGFLVAMSAMGIYSGGKTTAKVVTG